MNLEKNPVWRDIDRPVPGDIAHLMIHRGNTYKLKTVVTKVETGKVTGKVEYVFDRQHGDSVNYQAIIGELIDRSITFHPQYIFKIIRKCDDRPAPELVLP